jgi:DNA repair photolyase
MPGINDDPRQVEKILAIAGEMGAVSVGGIALHLRGEVRGVFMEWLRSYRPDLVERYEELYARGAYASREEQARLARLISNRRLTASWRDGAGMRATDHAPRTVARPQPLQRAAIQDSLF